MFFVFHDGVKTRDHVKTARRCREAGFHARDIQRLAILPWLGAVTGNQPGEPMLPVLGKRYARIAVPLAMPSDPGRRIVLKRSKRMGIRFREAAS
jgi:hypothetical protein